MATWRWGLNQLITTIVATLLNNYDFFCVVEGMTGCLAGNTKIQINRFKLSRRYSIETLYNHFQGKGNKGKYFNLSKPSRVRAFNGKDIRLHPIKDVVYSGIKEVYKLELESGHQIKATSNHKIMTSKGWIELGCLKNSDRIMIDTLKPEKKGRKRYKLREMDIEGGFHPHNIQLNRAIAAPKLIYEANMNKIHFHKFLDIIWNEADCTKKLLFLDKKYHIHHKDGNHYNNSIENLEKLTREQHNFKHKDNQYSNFGQGNPKFSNVKNISFIGKEKTYDIICEEPHHNFVANGIIVHNSGKSTLALHIVRKVKAEFNRLKNLKEETVEKYYELLMLKDKGISEEDFVEYLLDLKKNKAYGFQYHKDLLYQRTALIKFLNGWRGCAIGDEAVNMMFNRDFTNEQQKDIVKILNMMRDHNNLTIACIPHFKVLDNQVRDLCKMRLSVVRRGIAVIQTPNSTFYGRDKWDTANNEKIERDWLIKKSKRPQYSKLTTFRGLVKFPKLPPKVEARYQTVKNKKRTQIMKEEMGIDVKKEAEPEDKLYESLCNGGIKNMQILEGFAIANNLTSVQIRYRLRKRLQDAGMNPNLVTYFYDKKNKETIDIKFNDKIGDLADKI